jgi:hypothetical protein
MSTWPRPVSDEVLTRQRLHQEQHKPDLKDAYLEILKNTGNKKLEVRVIKRKKPSHLQDALPCQSDNIENDG